MKKSRMILYIVFMAAFFSWPLTLCGQGYSELMPEKSVWSFVNAKPAANWTTQFPLRGGKMCVGELHTDRLWPLSMPCAWMTTKLTLPADYKPGNLYLLYRYDDHAAFFVNGAPVYQCLGMCTGNQIKRIRNPLVPGDNFIAAFCENLRGDGYVLAVLLTDNQPALDADSILPSDGTWSYTFDNPGARWTTQSPLPRSKTIVGPISKNNVWSGQYKNVWMTRTVNLPMTYVPEEMIVEYNIDDNIWVYVNGVEVLQEGTTEGSWRLARDVKNPLKPGKNIIAVRAENIESYSYVGVDIYTRQFTEEDKQNPMKNISRPPAPRGGEEEESPVENLTEAEKQILRAMACFKIGQDKTALTALEKVAEENPKDAQANCVLGLYTLLKTKKRSAAFEYFQKAVKASAKDPTLLNNYAIAALENKKFDSALQAWERLAKLEKPPFQLTQNVGTLMALLQQKRVTMKDAEQTRLVDLYVKVSTGQTAQYDESLGFLLMPVKGSVAARAEYDAVFQQEMKRGKETLQGQPYELKWHTFTK